MAKYLLRDTSIHLESGNGIHINPKIHDDELFEYEIVDRLDYIDNLIAWIAGSTKPEYENDKLLMKADLKMLMNLEDDHVFSSIFTNDFIGKDDDKFDETCEALIELSKKLDDE